MTFHSSPAQLENLKKGRRFTKETASAAGKKGAKASAAAKIYHRSMRESLEYLLQLPWFDPATAPMTEVKCFADALNKATNMTVQEKILVAQVVAAIGGNTRAAEYIRDTIGQTILPDRTSGQLTEYEDDGFTEAIKASAVDVWGERHGRKKAVANKAGRKVSKVQHQADAAADVVDAEFTVPES